MGGSQVAMQAIVESESNVADATGMAGGGDAERGSRSR